MSQSKLVLQISIQKKVGYVMESSYFICSSCAAHKYFLFHEENICCGYSLAAPIEYLQHTFLVQKQENTDIFWLKKIYIYILFRGNRKMY